MVLQFTLCFFPTFGVQISKIILPKVDFLIVGQGIAGTLLSYELLCAGKSVLVLDNNDTRRSSLVAGAVINPMAGKHWTPSKDADVLITKAISSYHDLERLLSSNILKKTDLYVFHEQEKEKNLFDEKQQQFPGYFANVDQEEKSDSYFNAPFGLGKIEGLWLIDAMCLLQQWKGYLQQKQAYIQESFDHTALQLHDDKVLYNDIEANKIIFCEGAFAAENPFFKNLPFTRNRGEALLLDIPGLPQEHIYHRKLRLVPRSDGLFWCGSNYTWNFKNLHPDEQWKEDAIAELNSWLKLPFAIKDHIVAQRPTTAGQIPFIGTHPKHKVVAIFNGLGTRGFSSGPYWASAFSDVLTGKNSAILNYDGVRFNRFFE
jgi:glycine/D-amino acid oxidase-like deaminating enzyme